MRNKRTSNMNYVNEVLIVIDKPLKYYILIRTILVLSLCNFNMIDNVNS